MGGEGSRRQGDESKQVSRGHRWRARLFRGFPRLYILDFTVYLLSFLAPSPLSTPIQYLLKHYFMPLARETFTFKFSNIPLSLVSKQHMSVLQLLLYLELSGLNLHTPGGGGGAGAQDAAAAAATGLQSPRRRPSTARDARAGGQRSAGRTPGARHQTPRKGLLFQPGSTRKATSK